MKKQMASKTRRRSQSVSAVSRKESIISTQFSNSRDNPLFWATADDDVTEKSGEISRPSRSFVEKDLRNGKNNSGGGGELRGRSVTRSLSGKNGIGRSLSTARGRSASRPHRFSSDESEKGQNMVSSKRSFSTNGTKPMRNGLTRTSSVGNKPVDTRTRSTNARVSVRRNEVSDLSEDGSTCSLKISHVEDGISTSSLSEAEAKTIQDFYDNFILTGELSGDDMPLSETYECAQSEVKYALSDIQDDQRTASRRNNIYTSQNIVGMPSDIVDPGTDEFISGFQREYAIKLEEAEERARELRADLAIEEHRARELNRMLKETPPETSSIRKPRRGRRASNERRNMSELLTEDAMAYFDECVSLSTFDSSDFSASEDIPQSSLGANTPIDALSRVKGSSSTTYCYDQVNNLHQKQVLQIHGPEDSVISMSSSNMKSTTDTQAHQFSLDSNQKTPNSSALSADIQSYIKHFEKDVRKDLIGSKYKRSSYYDAEEYITNGRAELALIDRVLYRRSIESGGLVLCAGSSPSFMPFSSFI